MLTHLLNAYYEQNKKDWEKTRGNKQPILSETGSILSNKYLLWETYNLDNGE